MLFAGVFMKYKVGVIGRYGADSDLCDGQTVKTKNLVHLLGGQENISICIADTFYFRKNNIKLLIDTLLCLLKSDHVFLMVSVNGMNFYLRMLYYLNKLLHRHIYHYVIGSELLDMVEHNSKLVTYLNALDVNWFEFESGTRFLCEHGVTNVTTLPNFKLITPVEEATEYMPDGGIYQFCTFSRVMEEKGITDAILAIRKVNAAHGRVIAKLDIYGPVEKKYEAALQNLLAENSDCVTYCGVADSQNSVAVLKDYYALLFPTKWPGEGVPGTIIDSFASGIPIIASDWNANKELIEDGRQGILYPNAQIHSLEEAIVWAVQNQEEMNRMRFVSRQEYDNFTPGSVLHRILREMENRVGL